MLSWKENNDAILENWSIHYNEGSEKWTRISLIDLDKISNKSDEEIKNFILKYLTRIPRTITSKKDEELMKKLWQDTSTILEYQQMKYINTLYKKAIEYMGKKLFYWKELSNLRNRKFNNWQEVIKFIQETRLVKWRIKCSIIKMMLIVADSYEEFNPIITEIKKLTSEIVDSKLKLPIEVEEENERWQIRWQRYIANEHVKFIIHRREKSDESNAEKELKDPNYFTVDRIWDMYWVHFEVDKKEHIPLLMEYIASKIFPDGEEYVIKNKWLFNKNELEELNLPISLDFKEKLFSSLWDSKKWNTTKWYKEIKIASPIEKKDQSKNKSIEIQFSVSKNINETWIQMKWVREFLDRLDQRIRLEQCISPKIIEIAIDEFIFDMQKILNGAIKRENKNIDEYKIELFRGLRNESYIENIRLNKHTKSNIDKYIKRWLMNYYRDKLRPIKIGWEWKTRYTNSRWVELSKLGLWRNKLIPQD